MVNSTSSKLKMFAIPKVPLESRDKQQTNRKHYKSDVKRYLEFIKNFQNPSIRKQPYYKMCELCVKVLQQS